ncbi:MAG: death-on-curing protein [Patescibacteria group bacterium]|jgi:death-on-curing protein
MVVNNINQMFCFRCYHTWIKRIKQRKSKYCPKCKSPYWYKPRKRISKGIILKMQDMIINIHNTIIKISGGESGIRDIGGIYNSTYKILNYQGKNKRKPSNIGAFVLNEFAKRHYFTDGNKRTAYAMAKIFMLINNSHLKIDYIQAIDFIISVAEYNSKKTLQEILHWIETHSTEIEQKELENYLNKTALSLMLGAKEYDQY